MNGATCTVTGDHSYSCKCADGYEGDDCSFEAVYRGQGANCGKKTISLPLEKLLSHMYYPVLAF